MSQSYSFDPDRLVLSLPYCPNCGSPMWLARIEPDSPDYDKRPLSARSARTCSAKSLSIAETDMITYVRLWHLADIGSALHVRYWG